MQGNIQKIINNNQEWADVREGFWDFPPRYHPEKSIELINCCRASPKLRQLYPYSSLGRFGIWRYNPMEVGFADWFLCMYFNEGKYYVCDYENTNRIAFDTARAAVAFFEQHLHDENPLG